MIGNFVASNFATIFAKVRVSLLEGEMLLSSAKQMKAPSRPQGGPRLRRAQVEKFERIQPDCPRKSAESEYR